MYVWFCGAWHLDAREARLGGEAHVHGALVDAPSEETALRAQRNGKM